MHLKYVLILSAPTTSERIICPLLLTSMLTLSTTSKNTWSHTRNVSIRCQTLVEFKMSNTCKESTYFILLVPYPFTSPGHSIGYSHWRSLRNFHPKSISLDELTKNPCFSILRETKVHYFIKQLILSKCIRHH